MKPKRKHDLSEVLNPEGRVDVLLYQFVGRLMDRAERDSGVTGFREHFLPIVEQVIVANLPARNLIPPELQAALKVYQANRRRL